MSIFVSLEIIFPISTPTTVAINAPTGPPAAFPEAPVIVAANKTRGGALRAIAIATPIAEPVILIAIGATVSVRYAI